MPIQTVNPATEELVQTFEPHDDEFLDKALNASQRAHHTLRHQSFAERAACLRQAADLLDAERERWAAMLTLEMGKTLVAAGKEVDKCAWVCRYYADHGEQFLADQPVQTDARVSFRRYLPLGPILAVMPWNFPFWQVIRCLAPALMAGNTMLLKHASNVPQSALAIEEIFRRAGFDPGAMQTLLVGAGKVKGLLDDPRVRAATLTGSEPAGAAVAAQAGHNIKKTVLELGGSDPFIVMPSADLEKAVSAAIVGRVQNNGQSCIAAKRFIVHRDIYDDFKDAFVAGMQALTVGDPANADTDVGPLATDTGRQECHTLAEQFVELGAARLTGAELMDGPGFFYRPGILEVPHGKADRFTEELFGPVALLIPADSLDDAIAIGNVTPFGLGSAIFTREQSEIDAATLQLDAGSTFVNTLVASHPALPFGGVKQSGYGRELAEEGIREFVNIKSVYIAH